MLQHIPHMVLELNIDLGSIDFSVERLRGSTESGDRGLVDVILLKKDA